MCMCRYIQFVVDSVAGGAFHTITLHVFGRMSAEQHTSKHHHIEIFLVLGNVGREGREGGWNFCATALLLRQLHEAHSANTVACSM